MLPLAMRRPQRPLTPDPSGVSMNPMDGPRMDELALIEGCRRGERAAQHALYERHAERIYRLALRLCGNAQDAADITQDTFVRAFERISSFDGHAGIGTWLYRIATNEALQLFRRRGTEQRHLRKLAQEAASEAPTPPGDGDEASNVTAVLLQLSEHHRAILVLKYQEQLSYEDIAEVLGCAPGTVASRLNRARAELRAALTSGEPPAAEETHGPPHPNGGREM